MNDQKYSLTHLANALRILTADAVEKASSGHPGMPMGFADVMTVLAKEYLNFIPQDPQWPLRDRLILSAGHGSMLLYAFYYLTGYKDFTLENIKNFRQLHSITAGHPEYGVFDAIETTTGPLGQGIGNSVGMAVAQKKQQSTNNTLQHKIIAICGDGCLMEGIGYEAMSIAGHLQLNNLIWLFDDNHITIDGSTDLTHSENMIAKCQAMGWDAERVDGHDHAAISAALSRAYKADKPYFIACKTRIGYGSPSKEGSEASHGAPLGSNEVEILRKNFEISNAPFEIHQEVLDMWRSFGSRCQAKYEANQQIYYPAPSTDLDESLWKKLKDHIAINPEATRKSSGTVINVIADNNPNFIFGSADLSGSNNVKHASSKALTADNWNGNFLHYGPRESVMGAIMNGIATQGYKAASGTFLVFSDYMRPSMRLASIMHLPVIYIMTHDSIGVGEDGPTHQPIEHLSSFRAMPNIWVMRPCDYAETVECWQLATQRIDGPVLLSLSRQNLPQIRAHNRENLTAKGAYLIKNDGAAVDITIFATGSELSLAMECKEKLNAKNLKARIISAPCLELYHQQDQAYKDHLVENSRLVASIEAASTYGWSEVIGNNAMSFGIDQFGISAKAKDVYDHFELTAEQITNKIETKLQNI